MQPKVLCAQLSALCLMLVGACDASRPCDPGQRHAQGACIASGAPAPGVDSGSASLDADVPSDDDADGGDASAASDAGATLDAGCQEPLDASLDAVCMKSSECGCAAPFCAVVPGNTVGVCAVRDCLGKNAHECPTGYSCFDVSMFGVEGQPTFCLANSD